MKHFLKTWPIPFQAIWDEKKLFEWRLNDRDFSVGDELVLQEWDPETEDFSGREIRTSVTYVLEGRFGVPEGYAILSLGLPLVRHEP